MNKKNPDNLYKEIKNVIELQLSLSHIKKLDIKTKKKIIKNYIETFTNLPPEERKKLQIFYKRSIR